MTVDALVSAKQSPDGQRTDSRHEKWGPSGYQNFSYQARFLTPTDFSTPTYNISTVLYNIRTVQLHTMFNAHDRISLQRPRGRQ